MSQRVKGHRSSNREVRRHFPFPDFQLNVFFTKGNSAPRRKRPHCHFLESTWSSGGSQPLFFFSAFSCSPTGSFEISRYRPKAHVPEPISINRRNTRGSPISLEETPLGKIIEGFLAGGNVAGGKMLRDHPR